ncbi:hypothetical protein LEM8419_00612 [Neolewinella maritima]|uniref:Uncharacterized protein n=1 Tax=Neolewinella maritima TaxID=1383882 RepID=A0ABN8F5I9_9BACT|nr:hypothetical protein [Neolewinella maritima]CAH0999314.1 hypothetical protein LEM8419_00612 [Neolewinella maritima]
MPPTTLTFEPFVVYELRPDVKLPFQFVLCLSSTASNYRQEIKNVSFLPIIPAGRYADNDPYRVPLLPRPEGTTRLIGRMYVAVDAIQSFGKAAFLPTNLGHVTAAEEREVRAKVSAWLNLSVAAKKPTPRD